MTRARDFGGPRLGDGRFFHLLYYILFLWKTTLILNKRRINSNSYKRFFFNFNTFFFLTHRRVTVSISIPIHRQRITRNKMFIFGHDVSHKRSNDSRVIRLSPVSEGTNSSVVTVPPSHPRVGMAATSGGLREKTYRMTVCVRDTPVFRESGWRKKKRTVRRPPETLSFFTGTRWLVAAFTVVFG